MSNGNDIRIVLTLDGKQYTAGLVQAETETRSFASALGAIVPSATGVQNALNATGAAAGNAAQHIRGAQSGLSGWNRTAREGVTAATLLADALRATGYSISFIGALKLVQDLSETNLEFTRSRLALLAVSASSDLAAERFGFVKISAQRLGLDINSLAGGLAGLAAATRNTALEGSATERIFYLISAAAARMNLSAADTAGVLRAVQQIASKGTLSAEELRQQLGDRLPGAFEAAARAIGVTTAQLNDMLQKGEIVSTDFLPRFADELGRTFGVDMETRIDSQAASFSRLKNEIKLAEDELGGLLNTMGAFVSTGATALLERGRAQREGSGIGIGADLFSTAFGGTPTGGVSEGVIALLRLIGRGRSPGPAVVQPPFALPTDALNAQLAGIAGGPFGDGNVPFVASHGPLSEEQQRQLDIARERYNLLRLTTHEEKAVWEITEGRYKDEVKETKDLILAAGKLADLREHEKKDKKDATRDAREFHELELQASKNAFEQEEHERLKLADLNAQAQILTQQRVEGRELTATEREIIELKAKKLLLEGSALALSLAQVAALERLAQAEGKRFETLRHTLDELRIQEERIERDRVSGRISRFDAGRQTDAARVTEIARLQSELARGGLTNEQRRELEAWIDDIERARAPVSDLTRLVADLGANVATTFRTELSGSLAGLISGARSAREAWHDFADGVVNSLARISADILSTAALTALLRPLGYSLSGGGLSYIGGGAGGGAASVTSAFTGAVTSQGFIGPPDKRFRIGGGSAAGGGLTVQVINKGAPAKVESVEQGTGADGRGFLKVILAEVAGSVQNGVVGKAITQRYGLPPRPLVR